MAKTRGGLGRGLGSLLGDAPEELTRSEQKPVEDAVEEAVSPVSAPIAPATPETPTPADEKEEVKTVEEVEGGEGEEKELFTNREDNVVIKGVVERVVEKPSDSMKEESGEEAKDEEVEFSVDIDIVTPNPDQPRTNFKKEELEELAASIKKNGLLQPILVRKVEDKYQIIAGERRWQACKSLGMKKIPILVKDVDDDQTIILALVENIQRSDLNPIEEAYGYRRMMERGKMTQSEVAQAVSKGRSTVANALRLLELPEDAQQFLFEEKITAGHARAILSIPTKEGRRKLTDKLIENSISVREAESMARLLSGVKKESTAARMPQPKSYKTAARALRDFLESDVKIKSSGGKNKIEIAFKDETDLERILRSITHS